MFSIPETKGLSLEQVDELYQHSSIIGSNQYRQKILNDESNRNEGVVDEIRNDTFKDKDNNPIHH